MNKNENILEVNNLNIAFNNHKILEDISFEVKRDDTLAIIGPNGAGKTVLFKCLLGLLPYKGSVKWSPDARIGYVPQRLNVGKDVPITVEEFLKFKEKKLKIIEKTLKEVGFEAQGEHLLHKGKRLLTARLGVLSGGEFQRVVIAFALLGNPNVLLFDEPTSGVDISGEETVYALINRLQKEKDLTIIFISHELEVVYQYAANVLCLNKEKVCYGPPRIAIDKESLQQLYGEDIHFYRHKNDRGHIHHH